MHAQEYQNTQRARASILITSLTMDDEYAEYLLGDPLPSDLKTAKDYKGYFVEALRHGWFELVEQILALDDDSLVPKVTSKHILMCVHNDHRVYDEPEYESGDSELDEEELFMKYHGMEDSLNYACSYQRALKAVLAKFEGDLTFALSEAKRSKQWGSDECVKILEERIASDANKRKA